MESTASLLVVLTQRRPFLALGRFGDLESFELDGERFADVYAHDWIGFYDWHRSLGGDIAAVEFFPFPDGRPDFPFGACSELPYAQCDAAVSVTLLLDPAVSFEQLELHGDQAFGQNRLFRSSSGTAALTFGLDAVSEQDRGFLAAHTAVAAAQEGCATRRLWYP